MTRRLARSLAVGAVAAVALTGCVRATVDTTIGEDDTFSQHAIVAYSDDVANQISEYLGADVGSLVGSIDDNAEFRAFQERYPGQVTLEDYEEGDMHGVELTLTDLPLDEFSEAATQALASVDVSASLTHDDGSYLLSVTLNDDTGLAMLGLSDANIALVESSVDVEASFTFPGLVREATVGEIDGNTVTLGLADLATTPEIRIVADDSPSIDWGPLLIAIAVVAAFVLVIGGAMWLVIDDRRKSRRTALAAPVVGAASGPGVLSSADAEGTPRTGVADASATHGDVADDATDGEADRPRG